MTGDDDRSGAPTDEAGPAITGPAPAPAAETAAPDATPSSAEYTVAFTPRQVAVGFAILAGLVAFAVRRRRRRGRAMPREDD